MPDTNMQHLVAEALGHLNKALASFKTLVEAAPACGDRPAAEGRTGANRIPTLGSTTRRTAKAADAAELRRQAADAADVLGDLQLVHEEMTDIALRLGAAAYHWQPLPPGASSDG